jgi:hypothetical protein
MRKLGVPRQASTTQKALWITSDERKSDGKCLPLFIRKVLLEDSI